MATRFLADHASYQGSLTVADYHRADFDIVNFKTSHTLYADPGHGVHPRIVTDVAEAKRLKKGIGSFHWLTGDASGTEQARFAHGRLKALGLTAGTMHTVDVEEQADSDAEKPPTWAHVRDYVRTMQSLLGRPIALYTGDWWWTGAGRGWDGASLTPYLMAAANRGYPGSWGAATSADWRAGWGGWSNLSILQYAVDTLIYPDDTRSTVEVSKSAIRDDKVWQTLTGKA